MFTSDKDLRKPVAKKVAVVRPQRATAPAAKPGSSLDSGAAPVVPGVAQHQLGVATITTTSDLIEIARKEREQRVQLREQAGIVLRIQKWYRGRSRARQHHQQVADGIKAKLLDVEKISLLLAQKGAEFVTPPQLARPIILDFLFLGRYARGRCNELVTQLCTLVLNPSVTCLDASKNLAAYLLSQEQGICVLHRLCCLLLAILANVPLKRKLAGKTSKRPVVTEASYDKVAIARTLQLLVGASISYKMKYTPEIESAFVTLRHRLAVNDALFEAVRAVLLRRSEPLLSATSSSTTKAAPVSGAKVTTVSEADHLFTMLLFFIEATSSEPRQLESRLTTFITRTFSVPMLTLVLAPSTVAQFCQWRHFPQLLTILHQPSLLQALAQLHTTPVIADATWANPAVTDAQLMAHHPALRIILPGQWLLGNIAALSQPLLSPGKSTAPAGSPTRPAAGSPGKAPAVAGKASDASSQPLGVTTVTEEAVAGPEVLGTYLAVSARWLVAYSIPEVLQGRQGIAWQKQGANRTAVAVSSGLEDQLLTWMQPEVLQGLTSRVLAPIRTPDDPAVGRDGDSNGAVGPPTPEEVQAAWARRYGQPKDIAEVSESLASSAYIVTHKTLIERQQESTWFTAKWAKKVATNLTGGFALPSFSMFSSSGDKSSASTVKGTNTKVRGGMSILTGVGVATLAEETTEAETDPALVLALAGLWAVLLSAAASAAPESPPWRALTHLAFAGAVVPKLWCFLRDHADVDRLATGFALPLGATSTAKAGTTMSNASRDQLSVLYCIISVLRTQLMVLDDTELYEMGKPLPLHQVLRLVRCLKMILYKGLREDPLLFSSDAAKPDGSDSSTSTSSSHAVPQIDVAANQAAAMRRQICQALRAASAVVSDLYTRWARRPFSSATLWEVPEANTTAVKAEFIERTPFAQALFRTMPWAVDFHERMRLFRQVLDAERLQVQGSNDALAGGPQRSRGVIVRVRKARILEDGMEALARVGGSIKDRIVVRYVNDFGEEEAGIDAGGLFKDFVTDLSGRIFDPSYGLFCTTAAGLLYPNPAASVLFDAHEMDAMFVFLGRVLGKALFENITLQPQFAHFFLAFMHGKYNFMNLINDLHTLDPELYKNLMFLKTYEGDIADLGLTFAVTDTAMGGQREVELIPGGGSIDVTTQNRHRYINLVAKYYLHDRLKRQAKAFFSGLHQVVSPEQLSLFCPPELQILISGSQTGLSVDDLRQHTRYAGYVAIDRYMQRFWLIFAELSAEDQALLLKFVTSCERPPSLGFASLQPPFTIQRVDCSDDLRLPTASTCFNILKLPTYSSAKVMKDKLLQAIRAKAGFDLS